MFELESQVAKALDTQGNGLNVFDTNLALFSRLAKNSSNTDILGSSNTLKNLSQDEKEKVLRMFVSNAGEFHNLAKDTQLKSLNLNDYLADALIVAAKNVDSTTRAANYAKLLDDIITMQASAKEMLKIDPFLFENFKSKALGYALARFARLGNPSAKLFEFLKASKADLENLYTGNIFESNKAISDIDIYDFLKHAINSGEDLIDKQGRNIKGEITSRLDDLRKVENALIDSGEIQFAKSKAKPQGREAKETNINSLFADDELQMQATKPAKELNLSDEKDFNELSEFFKLNSKDKEFNEIFAKATKAAQRLGVKVRFDESAARSHFILNDNTITIAAANKEHFQAQDLLHELIHATTRKALKDFNENPAKAAQSYTKRQIEAINEIISLYQKSEGIAKRQGKDAYALQNVDEFVAELSSGEFRAFLKAQDIFERFIKALIRFFTGDSERLAKNVNSYKALKENYYKILDDYEPPLAPQKISDERALKSVDELNLSENLGKSQVKASEKELEILLETLKEFENAVTHANRNLDYVQGNKEILIKENKDFSKYTSASEAEKAHGEGGFQTWNEAVRDFEINLKEKEHSINQAKLRLEKAQNELKRKRTQIRQTIEQGTNTTPLKEFGTNYAEFYRDGQGAVKKLLAEKQGQVAGAFYRDDLAKATGTGEIDLVWGDSTKGLQHILERRAADFEKQGLTKEQATQKALEFVENDLNDIIAKGNISFSKVMNRVFFDTDTQKAVIALDYDSKDRKWVLTAFNKNDTASPRPADMHQSEAHGVDFSSSSHAEADGIIQQLENKVKDIREQIDEARKTQPNGKFSLKFYDEIIEPLKNQLKETQEALKNAKAPEIISKIEQKFGFDEKKAKDLYEWHKDSSPLTKEADGTPKVFYHGSKKPNNAPKEWQPHEVFEIQKNSYFNIGFWFGTNKELAKGYVNDGKLYEAFLNIKKPFIMEKELTQEKINEIDRIFNITPSQNKKALKIVENFKEAKKKWRNKDLNLSIDGERKPLSKTKIRAKFTK